MPCSAVSIVIPKLLNASLDVRDVDCWVEARLGRRRLLSSRVVSREDGLLGLLADVHLELARDSLLLGHCDGCVGVWAGEVLVYGARGTLVYQRKLRVIERVVVVEVEVAAVRVAATGDLARKDYARQECSSGQRERDP